MKLPETPLDPKWHVEDTGRVIFEKKCSITCAHPVYAARRRAGRAAPAAVRRNLPTILDPVAARDLCAQKSRELKRVTATRGPTMSTKPPTTSTTTAKRNTFGEPSAATCTPCAEQNPAVPGCCAVWRRRLAWVFWVSAADGGGFLLTHASGFVVACRQDMMSSNFGFDAELDSMSMLTTTATATPWAWRRRPSWSGQPTQCSQPRSANQVHERRHAGISSPTSKVSAFHRQECVLRDE